METCDEVCGRSKVDTWWSNEEVKEAISRKNDAQKPMCRNSTEGNMNRYKSMKSKVKKEI